MISAGGTIQSARLDLIPFTREFLRASLDGDREEAERLLGATLPKVWPDAPSTCLLRLNQLEENPSLLPWLMRGIVLRSTNCVIGHIGFHDTPGAAHLRELSPGGAEFGYTVFREHRRHGFALEAAEALMRWARTAHHVTRFVVSISPDNAPSLGMAAKLGFHRIGSHLDEEDGPEDIFERIIEQSEFGRGPR